jgi:hypothetical protein
LSLSSSSSSWSSGPRPIVLCAPPLAGAGCAGCCHPPLPLPHLVPSLSAAVPPVLLSSLAPLSHCPHLLCLQLGVMWWQCCHFVPFAISWWWSFPSHCSPFPPHEQWLVAVVGGAVVLVAVTVTIVIVTIVVMVYMVVVVVVIIIPVLPPSLIVLLLSLSSPRHPCPS